MPVVALVPVARGGSDGGAIDAIERYFWMEETV
jgi:hypothetical protein